MARPASLSNLSISQLENIIESRRSEISRLERRRNKIARKLDQLDRKIMALGGSGRSLGAGSRVRNEKSLTEMLLQVLTKNIRPMQVGDIVNAVRATGYRTKSANFRGIVNQTLIKDKRFSSAGRGLYQIKK